MTLPEVHPLHDDPVLLPVEERNQVPRGLRGVGVPAETERLIQMAKDSEKTDLVPRFERALKD